MTQRIEGIGIKSVDQYAHRICELQALDVDKMVDAVPANDVVGHGNGVIGRTCRTVVVDDDRVLILVAREHAPCRN